MSSSRHPGNRIRVDVQVNETDKTFSINVPWKEICESDRESLWEWLSEVKTLRGEWEAKGYSFK